MLQLFLTFQFGWKFTRNPNEAHFKDETEKLKKKKKHWQENNNEIIQIKPTTLNSKTEGVSEQHILPVFLLVGFNFGSGYKGTSGRADITVFNNRLKITFHN